MVETLSKPATLGILYGLYGGVASFELGEFLWLCFVYAWRLLKFPSILPFSLVVRSLLILENGFSIFDCSLVVALIFL